MRLFDNFLDPSANDTIAPDPSFPGALGARMAAWSFNLSNGVHAVFCP